MGNLTKGKHVIQEFDGVRCTVVETGIGFERMRFLKEILEGNRLEVKTVVEKQDDPAGVEKYTIAVTDLVFNPVIAMYARKLYLKDGRVVTPAYWNQQTDYIDPRYWRFKVKKENA
jgi:hypothetical protein